MNEAGTTWALVVGLDAYDDQTRNPPLSGSVRDAIAAVTWLRSLGVPDTQILLHASPSSGVQAELNGLGIAPRPGREADIAASMSTLAKVVGGTRLFIFLSGHGVFEPAGGRMFLLQDAGVGEMWKNIGIDGYVNWFLSLPFQRQFLFMDGCQNYPYPTSERPKMAPGLPVVPQIPNAANGLLACFAAAQDQYAIEIDGRGAFSRKLFEVLDLNRLLHLAPYDQLNSAITFDWTTGARTLDLNTLVNTFVKGPVRDITAQKGYEQTVRVVPYGAAADRHPVLQLPALPTVPLTISITPDNAVTDVMGIRVNLPSLYSVCDIPTPPAALAVPVALVAPQGVAGDARCGMRAGRWQEASVERTFSATAPVKLDFSLSAAVAPTTIADVHTISIKTINSDGNITDALGAAHEGYAQVVEELGYQGPIQGPGGPGVDIGQGVLMNAHETGPVLQVPTRAASRAMARRVSRAVKAAVPPGVSVETRVWGLQTPIDEARIVFVFAPGGAEALAGAIAGRPAVSVHSVGQAEGLSPLHDPRAQSLDELERNPVVDVRPGPKRIKVELPWGTWSALVSADPARPSTVQLPSSIGTPPLRVLLWHDVRDAHASLLITGDGRPHVELRAPGGGAPAPTAAERIVNPGAWKIQLPAKTTGLTGIIENEGRRMEFPLYGDRALAIERGAHFRVEPLSVIDAPEWDFLVAKGELDALDSDQAGTLTNQKWFDPLLGVAGGYALYAQQNWNTLRIVVMNLRGIGALGVDVELLDLAARTHGEPLVAANIEQLTRTAGEVPVFRWGVRLARSLIEAVDRPAPALLRWWGRLDRIERTMARTSVWTTWTTR